MSDTYDLIMAAYRGTEAAGRDFDALAVLVRDRQIASEGLILVEKDVEGRVTVRQTGDHLGRAGLGWGGGVGLLVGLSSGDGTAANARCVAKGSPGIASAAAPAAPAFRTSLREIPGDPLAIAHPLPRSPDLPPD